ncbi:hypothetical protein CONCODRAFT_6931 [Conidiobolus coronatus NRRL 28638]|uniref:Uncharacterized protein n=1 Tax=Conidiobolus coronatus (strain ATCC 28846 / CBS 209.66 / NRRL 28638) TaxID=796925 RepID=A0A137P695_CONC2|nr:hypothetical protein CONCODRAFT_6931 [Conidiobolus coronatus NRRL 28638]|eukprot:KXN70516.1 hypothetical protein CONCODRAFT_6931 [Conidiobolus coronatus NRRL 28638]
MIKSSLVYLFSLLLLLGFTRCDNLADEFIQVPNEYFYESYYSSDKGSCIIANKETGNKPTIQLCNDKYKVSNHSLTLPRNTFPICAYFPDWYDLKPDDYKGYIKFKALNGNITYDKSMKECAAELSTFSKSRFKDMYNANTHELMCIRVSEYKIESLIQDKVKWDNTEFQADLIMSSFCFDINKQGCIALVQHLIDERDNSALNLLGYDINTTPTTWLYADGIDIIILHIITEIFGMTLELKVIGDVNYYTISPKSPTEEFKEYKAGLVGGLQEHK